MTKVIKKTHFVFISNIDLAQLEMIESMISEDEYSYMNVLCLNKKASTKVVDAKLRELRRSYYDRLLVKEDLFSKSRSISLMSVFGINRYKPRRRWDKNKKAIYKFIEDYSTFAEKVQYHIIGGYKMNECISNFLMKIGVKQAQISKVVLNNDDEHWKSKIDGAKS